jgi:hypothetical protein
VEFLADALAKECADAKAGERKKESEKKAVKCYRALATELDPMRKP